MHERNKPAAVSVEGDSERSLCKWTSMSVRMCRPTDKCARGSNIEVNWFRSDTHPGLKAIGAKPHPLLLEVMQSKPPPGWVNPAARCCPTGTRIPARGTESDLCPTCFLPVRGDDDNWMQTSPWILNFENTKAAVLLADPSARVPDDEDDVAEGLAKTVTTNTFCGHRVHESCQAGHILRFMPENNNAEVESKKYEQESCLHPYCKLGPEQTVQLRGTKGPLGRWATPLSDEDLQELKDRNKLANDDGVTIVGQLYEWLSPEERETKLAILRAMAAAQEAPSPALAVRVRAAEREAKEAREAAEAAAAEAATARASTKRAESMLATEVQTTRQLLQNASEDQTRLEVMEAQRTIEQAAALEEGRSQGLRDGVTKGRRDLMHEIALRALDSDNATELSLYVDEQSVDKEARDGMPWLLLAVALNKERSLAMLLLAYPGAAGKVGVGRLLNEAVSSATLNPRVLARVLALPGVDVSAQMPEAPTPLTYFDKTVSDAIVIATDDAVECVRLMMRHASYTVHSSVDGVDSWIRLHANREGGATEAVVALLDELKAAALEAEREKREVQEQADRLAALSLAEKAAAGRAAKSAKKKRQGKAAKARRQEEAERIAQERFDAFDDLLIGIDMHDDAQVINEIATLRVLDKVDEREKVYIALDQCVESRNALALTRMVRAGASINWHRSTYRVPLLLAAEHLSIGIMSALTGEADGLALMMNASDRQAMRPMHEAVRLATEDEPIFQLVDFLKVEYNSDTGIEHYAGDVWDVAVKQRLAEVAHPIGIAYVNTLYTMSGYILARAKTQLLKYLTEKDAVVVALNQFATWGVRFGKNWQQALHPRNVHGKRARAQDLMDIVIRSRNVAPAFLMYDLLLDAGITRSSDVRRVTEVHAVALDEALEIEARRVAQRPVDVAVLGLNPGLFQRFHVSSDPDANQLLETLVLGLRIFASNSPTKAEWNQAYVSAQRIAHILTRREERHSQSAVDQLGTIPTKFNTSLLSGILEGRVQVQEGPYGVGIFREDVVTEVLETEPHIGVRGRLFGTMIDLLDECLVNPVNPIMRGKPLAHWPIESDNASFLLATVAHGADANALNERGDTPLLAAVRAAGTSTAVLAVFARESSDEVVVGDVDNITSVELELVKYAAERFITKVDYLAVPKGESAGPNERTSAAYRLDGQLRRSVDSRFGFLSPIQSKHIVGGLRRATWNAFSKRAPLYDNSLWRVIQDGPARMDLHLDLEAFYTIVTGDEQMKVGMMASLFHMKLADPGMGHTIEDVMALDHWSSWRGLTVRERNLSYLFGPEEVVTLFPIMISTFHLRVIATQAVLANDATSASSMMRLGESVRGRIESLLAVAVEWAIRGLLEQQYMYFAMAEMGRGPASEGIRIDAFMEPFIERLRSLLGLIREHAEKLGMGVLTDTPEVRRLIRRVRGETARGLVTRWMES